MCPTVQVLAGQAIVTMLVGYTPIEHCMFRTVSGRLTGLGFSCRSCRHPASWLALLAFRLGLNLPRAFVRVQLRKLPLPCLLGVMFGYAGVMLWACDLPQLGLAFEAIVTLPDLLQHQGFASEAIVTLSDHLQR